MSPELQEQIDACTHDLDDVRTRIEDIPGIDKLKMYLTQYALIRASGTVEYVYRSIVADHFNQYNIPQIDTYLDKNIRSGSMSASYDNMSKLLGFFDNNWQKRFKDEVKSLPNSKRIIQSSESLKTNRHLFAHGKSATATFNEIYCYYKDILILIELLDKAVNQGEDAYPTIEAESIEPVLGELIDEKMVGDEN